MGKSTRWSIPSGFALRVLLLGALVLLTGMKDTGPGSVPPSGAGAGQSKAQTSGQESYKVRDIKRSSLPAPIPYLLKSRCLHCVGLAGEYLFSRAAGYHFSLKGVATGKHYQFSFYPLPDKDAFLGELGRIRGPGGREFLAYFVMEQKNVKDQQTGPLQQTISVYAVPYTRKLEPNLRLNDCQFVVNATFRPVRDTGGRPRYMRISLRMERSGKARLMQDAGSFLESESTGTSVKDVTIPDSLGIPVLWPDFTRLGYENGIYMLPNRNALRDLLMDHLKKVYGNKTIEQVREEYKTETDEPDLLNLFTSLQAYNHQLSFLTFPENREPTPVQLDWHNAHHQIPQGGKNSPTVARKAQRKKSSLARPVLKRYGGEQKVATEAEGKPFQMLDDKTVKQLERKVQGKFNRGMDGYQAYAEAINELGLPEAELLSESHLVIKEKMQEMADTHADFLASKRGGKRPKARTKSGTLTIQNETGGFKLTIQKTR